MAKELLPQHASGHSCKGGGGAGRRSPHRGSAQGARVRGSQQSVPLVTCNVPILLAIHYLQATQNNA